MNIDIYDNDKIKCYETANCPKCGELVVYDPKEVKYVVVCGKCGKAFNL